MATASVAVIILLAYMALGSSQLISHSVLHHIDRHLLLLYNLTHPDDMRKAM